MHDYSPIYFRGEHLLRTIEELLPRCKDKLVRAKLRNGQTVRLTSTFFSVVNPDLSDQVSPDIACNVTATKGGEYVTVNHLYESLLAVKKLEPSFEYLDATVLLYSEDVDEAFAIGDHLAPLAEELEDYKPVHDTKYHLDIWDDYSVPYLYPIKDIVEKDDGITLVCYEFGLFAPDYDPVKYGLDPHYYEYTPEQDTVSCCTSTDELPF